MSYNRFVAALNRTGRYLAHIITAILQLLGKSSQFLKFADSTNLPVCLNKNGKSHRTMKGLAAWSKTGKGWFYGLKLHPLIKKYIARGVTGSLKNRKE